ncbi:hypothetical protein, partial [Nocardia abscessus]|uniref:hypothetical protein n=1 Tax=Nocardia abscessus TaxID=120957 RepID=UPI0024562437
MRGNTPRRIVNRWTPPPRGATGVPPGPPQPGAPAATPLTNLEHHEPANRFARSLIPLGAGPESLVAIAMPRDADLIVAVLG